MKTFEIDNETITVEKTGCGPYILTGTGASVPCNDSEIRDWCDDEENKEKHQAAKETAYRPLVNNL